MMAAMLYPERRVMAVCGDGGFMMNSQEMETAVRLGLNLVVLILNDNAYGMIRWKQAVDGFPDFGLTFGNPDFVRYAEAYGAKGSRVSAVGDLVPTLEAAFTGGGVHLVDVPIDYSENTRVLVEELRNRSARRRAAPERGWSVRTMLQVVQAFDRAPIAEVDDRRRRRAGGKLQAAQRVFRDRDGWLKPHERIAILRRLAALMEAQARPSRHADRARGRQAAAGRHRRGHRAIDGVRNAADELRNFAGREIPMGLTAASDGPLGLHDQGADRRRRRDLGLQPSAEPDRASGGAGDRRRLPGHRQAGAATPLCCLDFVALVARGRPPRSVVPDASCRRQRARRERWRPIRASPS